MTSLRLPPPSTVTLVASSVTAHLGIPYPYTEARNGKAQQHRKVATEWQREKRGHEVPAQDAFVVVLKKDLRAPYWEGRSRDVN